MNESIEDDFESDDCDPSAHNILPSDPVIAVEVYRARMIAQDLAFQEAVRRAHPERCVA